jgi:hypothetical protein
MTWYSRLNRPIGGDGTARLEAARAAVSAEHAQAISLALTELDPSPRALMSYADAVALVCAATTWPVGHVWLRAADGWQSSSWHDSGEQFADLKAATEATDLGSGRGIVAAVMHLEACRFLPGLEGLGSDARRSHAAALGLRAVVGVPVRSMGKVDAVFEFVTDVEVEPDGPLAEALLAVAGRSRRRVPGPAVVSASRRLQAGVELPAPLVHLAG